MADDDSSPAGRGLKIHHLRPAPGARTDRTRVGRGAASKGKTAGRGTKGSKARGPVAPGFEVNGERLAALYPDGGDVTPEDLAAKGAVRPGELVKVLGSGDAVPKGLRVSAHAFSATAREKITAAGGTVTEL